MNARRLINIPIFIIIIFIFLFLSACCYSHINKSFPQSAENENITISSINEIPISNPKQDQKIEINSDNNFIKILNIIFYSTIATILWSFSIPIVVFILIELFKYYGSPGNLYLDYTSLADFLSLIFAFDLMCIVLNKTMLKYTRIEGIDQVFVSIYGVLCVFILLLIVLSLIFERKELNKNDGRLPIKDRPGGLLTTNIFIARKGGWAKFNFKKFVLLIFTGVLVCGSIIMFII